ncbi:hypothetical protein VXS03_00195 [Photobacterium sp. S4TG1]|uniref:hypothetical protein n=1 Tax=Photobacterium sp. S4TG1 TaxID=3114587 RepID=UPI002E16C039|nr:hypothetical protein [Photobacterium sp. S4TG1]
MRQNKLQLGARFSLFIVSYFPLFFIMCFTQVYKYSEYLNWGGFNEKAILVFIKYFGAVTFLCTLSLIGIIGLMTLLKNVSRRCDTNGRLVQIKDIENKNSESITYLFTYLIPFVFQDLSSVTNVVSITVLLIVTFLIYINSGMILINPTISLKYTLFQITYIDIESKNKRNGMILTKNKYLEDDDLIDIEIVGHKLFYAKLAEED